MLVYVLVFALVLELLSPLEVEVKAEGEEVVLVLEAVLVEE